MKNLVLRRWRFLLSLGVVIIAALYAFTGGFTPVSPKSAHAAVCDNILQDGDYVALRTYDGHYVSAVNGGGGPVGADRVAANVWETFTFRLVKNIGLGYKAQNYIALQTYDGHYISAINGGGGTVGADRVAANIWETFALYPENNDIMFYPFRCSGDTFTMGAYDGTHFLTATNGGGSSLTAVGGALDTDVIFTILKM